MSELGTTLADAAKAYKDACRDRDAVEAAFRDACLHKDALHIQQEEAQSRANKAARFLRLVALHGPVEEWARDYMKDGEPTESNAGFLGKAINPYQQYQNTNLRNAQ